MKNFWIEHTNRLLIFWDDLLGDTWKEKFQAIDIGLMACWQNYGKVMFGEVGQRVDYLYECWSDQFCYNWSKTCRQYSICYTTVNFVYNPHRPVWQMTLKHNKRRTYIDFIDFEEHLYAM